MLSFAEKRALQQSIIQQNAIIASKPGFKALREAQKAKADALQKLGLIKQQSNTEAAIDAGSGENSESQLNSDQAFGLQKSGIKTRERINSQVASIVDQIQAGRDPSSLTDDEMALFRQYSGKGGLTENSQHEYYTPTHVAEGIWDMLKENGLGSGNVLEPSTGAGVFSATKQHGVVITGTEIDPIAATVNKVLHPDDHIFNQSFEKLAVSTPDNFFDGVIGNVPFGDVRGAAANDDPQYKKEKFIERYFINRVIDKTRPGGLIALVVPTRVIGSTQSAWKKFRAEISRKAEFLGGHKLPSKTFGKQGTDVVTDILVMRKHSDDLLEKIDGYPVDTLQSANVLWDEFISGKYWQGEGRKYIKGQYVPPNKDDFRPMEKVIADEGMTDQALKQSLAVHFDSRIDWAMLDSVEPVINYYVAGDRRVIAGKEYEFDGERWAEVQYALDSASISRDKFGADTIDDLAEMLKSPESALSLTFEQAQAVLVAYPNLVAGQLRDAILFAQSQPLDSYREQAWRGSIIGSVVTKYIARANNGETDDLDRQRIKNLLETEYARYGHPRSIKGFRLDGEQARYFGSFLKSIDEQGKVSAVIETGIADATGYNAEDPLSIVEYFIREGLGDVTLEDLQRLYTGARKIVSLGDIADIPGLVITPAGFISTVNKYCNGLIYDKSAEIQNQFDGETDPRVRDHYQRVIDIMMSKAKRTSIEDITFGLRDKWYDAKYKLEFLEKSGYRFQYVTTSMVEKESDTGETYLGVEKSLDTSIAGGLWSVDGSQRKKQIFARQLEYYMNGQSIGYRMQKEDERDKEVIAKLREQVNALEEQFKYFMQAHPDFQEIERRYNMTFNHYVKPDYDDSDLGLKGMSGKMKMHWYQNQGIRQLSEEGTGILGFDVGLGKAQPLDAKILTPNGWVLMGDIKVGDLVIASDGSHVPVTGVYPQGEKEIYEVEFSDGSKTRCCDEHLWFTKTEKDRKNERHHARNGNDIEFHGSVKPLSEIRQSLIYQTQKNHAIPISSPTDFFIQDKNKCVSPYVMGVLLGDGCFKSGGITFTPGDDEIAKYVSEQIKELMGNRVEVKVVNSKESRAKCYSISQGNIGGTNENPVKGELRRLGLDGLGSHEKFIPETYKLVSVEDRISLLRGLMDTDGYVSKDGITVQFTSTSKQLALDVVFLVQSLSGIAWIKSKIPTFTHKGERREGREAFTVSMRFPAEINPFRLARKAERVKSKSKYKPIRFFTKVENIGLAPAQCIAIDHPSHLYVTDDFIVTHNTFSALGLSAYDRQMGRSKKHCVVVPNSVLANWYMESKTLYGNHDDVMFVGFEPVYKKDGGIEQEPILDENGNPKVNAFTGEIEYQDKLRKESPDEIYAKMHSIPHTSKSVVIMTQEKFKDIPLREETRLGYAEKWVDKAMMSKAQAKKLVDGGDKEVSYNDAKAQDRLRGQFSDEGGIKKDQYPFFEDMGFDRVIVDEAHQFRNSYGIQDGDTAKLAYLPNAAVSQRATDMAMKCAYLRDRYNNKGPIMLTATPVANSPIEIFNMLSLVIDQSEFERMGIYTPDDFVRQFGIIQDVDKLTVRGTVEKREGLAGFKNLNALRGLFHRYALMRGPKDVDPDGSVMKLPTAVEMIDQLDMTGEQSNLYVSLRQEAKAARDPKKVASGEARPMFAILRDMDRVTTDPDMYYGKVSFVFKREEQPKLDALIASLPDEVSQSYEEDEETGELKRLPPGSKKKGDNIITKQVKKVTDYTQSGDTLLYVVPDVYGDFVDMEISKQRIEYVSHPLRPKYAKLMENMRAELSKKGKQLVFTEEKSQHTKLLRLISNHLPVTADQVAVINADTAAGEKLQQISDAFNRGDVRIIIANKKAEVGVNLQKGTSAIHHLTLPWNPASLQQRNGRGVRQGNTQPDVRVYYYQARGSFDEYRLDLLKNKGNWIAALMDRHADNDSAENAEAMGAIEQAALLSDNREEFLKTMAEMQAKKDAEAKAKRDSAAKIKLNQLAIQANFLAGFDAQLETAKVDADKAVSSAQSRVDRLVEQGASEDELSGARSRLAYAIKKRDGLDSVWEKKKSDAEQQMRQNTAFLKGLERQGQLSFDGKLVDNPSKNILTKDQKIVTVGSVFRLADNKVVRITDFDFYKRTANVEAIVGYYYGKDADIDKLLEKATELELTQDELEKMKWLATSHTFADFAQVDRDFFFANLSEISISGDILYYQGGSELKWGSKYYAMQEGNSPVYPDRNDKKLISDLTAAYKAMKLGSQQIQRLYFQRFMPVVFGENWEESLLESMKVANREDMLAKAVYYIDSEISGMDDSTKAGCSEIIKQLTASTYGENAYSRSRESLKSWMIENDFVNGDDIYQVMQDATSGKIAQYQEKRRQHEADEQRAKEQELKNVPGYKEIPAEIKAGFKELGIDIFYNDEVVQINNRWTKKTYQPFDMLWMLCSGVHLKNRISGKENPIKRRFDAEYFNASYSSELPQGDRKYGQNSWRVPGNTDLEALLQALS